MRGVKSEDLKAIIDFFYCGEANVFQENLDSFLAIAEELKLKGLMGNTDEKGVKPEETPSVHMNTAAVARKYHNDQQLTNISNRYEKRVAIPTTNESGNLKALDEQVKSMMEKSQNMIQVGNTRRAADICKVCGKEGQTQNIQHHIEANHLDGVSLTCNNCEKIFRSRASLRMHKCKIQAP